MITRFSLTWRPIVTSGDTTESSIRLRSPTRTFENRIVRLTVAPLTMQPLETGEFSAAATVVVEHELGAPRPPART